MTWIVSVPAKIMLAGEYSVLAGHSGLSATLSDSCQMRFSHRDSGFELVTTLWQQPRTFPDLHALSFAAEDDLFCEAVHNAAKSLDVRGARVSIPRCFSSKHGFGSSSAIRLASYLGLSSLRHQQPPAADLCWQLAEGALEDQRQYQGRASGYDFLTQLTGGLVRFSFQDSPWPGSVERWLPQETSGLPSLTILVGGRGDDSSQSISSTWQWLQEEGDFPDYCIVMDALVEAIRHNLLDAGRPTWPQLMELISEYHQLMRLSPNYPRQLMDAIRHLPGFGSEWSLKPTGAGGQDALLLFAQPKLLPDLMNSFHELGWYAHGAQVVEDKTQVMEWEGINTCPK